MRRSRPRRERSRVSLSRARARGRIRDGLQYAKDAAVPILDQRRCSGALRPVRPEVPAPWTEFTHACPPTPRRPDAPLGRASGAAVLTSAAQEPGRSNCSKPEVLTLLAKKQTSARRLGRPARKANSESLDEAGNAAQVHIKLVTRAKRREPLWIRSTVE